MKHAYSWKNYTIKLSTDISEIKSVLESEYEKLAYDGSPSLKNFNVDDGIWFILLFGDQTAGFITLKPLNNIMWSPHVFIYKQYRGEGSEYWGRLVAQHMRDNFGARKFLAFTPYIMAKRYAERVGFKLVAILENSILKNSKLVKQYVLEMGT